MFSEFITSELLLTLAKVTGFASLGDGDKPSAQVCLSSRRPLDLNNPSSSSFHPHLFGISVENHSLLTLGFFGKSCPDCSRTSNPVHQFCTSRDIYCYGAYSRISPVTDRVNAAPRTTSLSNDHISHCGNEKQPPAPHRAFLGRRLTLPHPLAVFFPSTHPHPKKFRRRSPA